MSEQKNDKQKQIKFRVSENEYIQLSEKAKIVCMSVPSFSKKMALNGVVKSPKINRDGALEIAKQLRKIGTNVNQIAYKINTGGNVVNNELQQVQKELGEIWQLLNLALQNQQTD